MTDPAARTGLGRGILMLLIIAGLATALLGLLQQDPEAWFAVAADSALSAEAINEMIEKRNAARAAKDFATADALRDELAAAGIQIEDGAGGTTWRKA